MARLESSQEVILRQGMESKGWRCGCMNEDMKDMAAIERMEVNRFTCCQLHLTSRRLESAVRTEVMKQQQTWRLLLRGSDGR